MLTVGQQRIDVLPLALVGVLTAVAVGIGLAWPLLLPWAVAGMVLAVVMVFWSIKGDVTLWAWLWVLSYGFLDWPEWKIQTEGFFDFTVPRLIFLGTVGVFTLHLFFHRVRMRMDRSLLLSFVLLAGYLIANTHMTGWTAQTEGLRTAPYYRLIGSLLLPFTMFFLLAHVELTERQIVRTLILVTLFGWFALYIGYLQYAAIEGVGWARSFIWPNYINDPSFGIHFDRARGPFAGSSPQAVFLVALFYVDLFLLGKLRGPYRILLIVQAVLIPPAIFFTLLRSAYLAFLLCGVIWIFYAGRRRYRWLKLACLLLVICVGIYAGWNRLSGRDRSAGGVAQASPIRSRFILAAQTWDLFKRYPVTGVGFGKFVDAQMDLAKDPSSLTGEPVGVLVQHNLFLNMLAETGLVGLALTLLVFWGVFRQSRQLHNKLPSGARGFLCRDFVVLYWVILAGYLIDAMFRDPLWDVFSNAMLWSFTGLMVAYNRLLQPWHLGLPESGSA
jgi:O-antigen ligase